MHRYNMFHQIHKGLRALLYETAIQLQHTDFWNVDDAEEVIGRIREVVRLFHKHAHSEDTFVFSAVAKYEPSVADAFEQEHVKDHELGEQLAASLAAYQAAPVITEKAIAGKQINEAFTRFLVFNLEHMAKEEDLINKVLWRYYRDEELKGITHQIVSNIPPEYMGLFGKWMLRGLNIPEIAGWLREIEQTAPEPVFKSLFTSAEKELSIPRFRKVMEGLSEGAMVA